MDKMKVLLVDDEHELVTTLVERLEYRDIEADCAFSGLEALEKMLNAAYSVIVVDLKMPGMSGSDLIREIQKRHPEIPVLLMTGHGIRIEEEDIPEGIADFLPKPVSLTELISKMYEVTGKNE